MAAVREFVLTAECVDSHVRPYRTGLINRNSSKITMIYMEVGPHSDSAPPQNDPLVT